MVVQVTKGDLIHGKRLNPLDCAVARAIKRVAAPGSFVSVDRHHLRVGTKVFGSPASVHDAVLAIDSGWGQLVEPFSFELGEGA